MDRIVALGQIVRKARRAALLSQEKLAEKANLHRNFISLIERGESKIAIDSLFAIADALKVPASKLLSDAETAARR